MEGLFYFHDMNGLTFFRLFSDKKVISYGKYARFDQSLHEFPWFQIESDKVYYARGFYEINEGKKIRIIIKGDYGTMIYRGTIKDVNTMDLSCRCPFTNCMKTATFLRFSEEKHIIHFELSDVCAN